MRAREPASFWRENVIAVVILLRKFRSGGNRLSNVGRFMILRSGKGLSFFNKNNCANVSGEKKYSEVFRAKNANQKNFGQYTAIFTKQAWSITNLSVLFTLLVSGLSIIV